MGKGRDKRKKREDPTKAAQRAAKQAHKLSKKLKKSQGAGDAGEPEGFNNEEAIEVTLKRIQKAESRLRTVDETPNVAPPSPRANVVFAAHPTREGELMVFGGEYWNGEVTTAYNDLYFYNVKRDVWAKLSTAVNPAPRSSSQGITYKHYLIIFGGEFVSQSQSQYLHFKDVWRFNAHASAWEELKPPKGGPSCRSGHRMVLWKRSAVVFGGFYDNAQECHYYNDLWLLSSLDGAGRWTALKTSPLADSPHPRSGHCMAVYGDQLFVYGGYSAEKFNRFKKSQATVHHDLWVVRLHAPDPEGGEPTDGLPMWQKIRFGGVPPPIRCGVAAAFKDRRMYLFGGVVDLESPGGALVSTFHNDLFALHMDTKRFFPVMLRRAKARAARGGSGDGRRSGGDLNELEAQLGALRLAAAEPSDTSEDSDSDSDSEGGESGAPCEGSQPHQRQSYEVDRRGQIVPCRRMDAALVVAGSHLYVFGGQFECGQREVTMADLFELNLNRLDAYRVLLSQDLDASVWLGKESEGGDADSWESGSTVVSGAFGLDLGLDDEEGEGEGDEEGEGSGPPPHQAHPDDGDEAPEAIPAELEVESTPCHAEVSAAVDFITHTRSKKGLQVHKAQLLAQLGASAAVPTPQKDEPFKGFWERTQSFWLSAAKDSFEGGSACSARRLQKEATAFARRRHHEVQELLAQLAVVEEREKEEANFLRERRLQKEREWAEYEKEQQRLEAAVTVGALRWGHAPMDGEDESDDGSVVGESR